VIIKKVSLPVMSREELEQSIQWEAEQYIPFNIHDVNLDYQILSPVAEKGEDPGSGQMDVLLVAAKKDLVEDYASLLREADLRPVIMDVASFAVENMYEINADVDEDEVMAIFNIGASITNINIFKNGASLFTRDIHFGGNQFNEEIQKALNLNFQEAEYLKLGGSGREEDQREVQEILERITEVLLNETQRSLEFFSATSGSEKIHRVVLCGGCSALPGLAGRMEDRLGTPVDLADPFRRVIADPGKFKPEYLKEIQPFMGVSVGLALRSVGD
jgi:type IV pilus assembly protein PilM